jgi:preprotein translocase subunit SecG
MSILIIILHVVVSIALILIVLLQTGKGADMGAAFGGGGSQTLFGSTGASTFLSKATTGAAIIFMLTSLALAYMSGQRGSDSIMTGTPPAVEQQTTQDQSAPAVPATGQPEAPAPKE